MRYAVTEVETTMQNTKNGSEEIIFDMYIPRQAFVSKFSMKIQNKTYEAKVKTKQNATEIFQSSNTNSGLLENQEMNKTSELFNGSQYVRKIFTKIKKNRGLTNYLKHPTYIWISVHRQLRMLNGRNKIFQQME